MGEGGARGGVVCDAEDKEGNGMVRRGGQLIV